MEKKSKDNVLRKDARRICQQRDLDMVVVLGVRKGESTDGLSLTTYGKTKEDSEVALGMGTLLYHGLIEYAQSIHRGGG